MKSIPLPGLPQSSNDRARSLPALSFDEAGPSYDIEEDYSATSAGSTYSNQRPVTPVSFDSVTSSGSAEEEGQLKAKNALFRHRSLSATARTLGRRLSKIRPRNASFSAPSRHSALPSLSEVFTENRIRLQSTHITIEEIHRISPGDLDDDAIVLLIGGTGTGKSNFIEKLASGQIDGSTARISDSKLYVGTSDIRTYRMKHNHANLWTSQDIILVDTPGLSHQRNTEWWVLSQIKAWMQDNGVTNVDHLLYFDRISDNRMRRSRGRSSTIFKSICGKHAANRALVVTTMWDEMWNERLRAHAAERYHALQHDYWKDFVQHGCRIEKFDNTFVTAINALQQLSSSDPNSSREPLFILEQDFLYNSLRETDAGRIAFRALQERQENLIADQQAVIDDLRFSAQTNNQDLTDILQTQFSLINSDITDLMSQLQDYSPQYNRLRDEVRTQFDRPDSRASSVGSGASRLYRLQNWLLRLGNISLPKGRKRKSSTPERIYASQSYSQSAGTLPCLYEIPD